MKQINGLWFPDHEKHLYAYANGPIGEWTYQKEKLDAAVKFCRKKQVAIDVGGHCGLWSKEMCKMFWHVHAFEPVKDHRDCFQLNVMPKNYTLYPYALGEKNGRASLMTHEGVSGNTWIVSGGDVEIKPLDYFDLVPDFIKIDCEGYELFVLKGAVETIKKHRPAIIVEQKPGHAPERYGLGDTDAVQFLEDLGYTMHMEFVGDYILSDIRA